MIAGQFFGLRAAAAIFGLLAMICASQNVQAGVIVKEQTSYYKVYGKTGAEIYRSMSSRGWWGTRHSGALASISPDFKLKNAKTKISGQKCVLASFDVELQLHYRYPNWDGHANASSGVHSAWKSFSAAAIAHEKTHAEIFKKYAGKLEQEMRRATADVRNGCNKIDAVTEKKIKNLVAAMRKEHAAFDARESAKTGRGYKAQLALAKAK